MLTVNAGDQPRTRCGSHHGDKLAVDDHNLAQLAIGVLGVLAISGEYATGMIRSGLMAVPRRPPVLWAKLGVFAVVTFVLMLVAALVCAYGAAVLVLAALRLVRRDA